MFLLPSVLQKSYKNSVGISKSISNRVRGTTENLQGITSILSTGFPFKNQTAINGNLTKKECMGILVGSSKRNKSGLDFLRNINPRVFEKKLEHIS